MSVKLNSKFLKVFSSVLLTISIIGCNFQPPVLNNKDILSKTGKLSGQVNSEVIKHYKDNQEVQFVNVISNLNLEKKFGFNLKAATRVEETDPSVTYKGVWDSISDSNSSAGAYKQNNGDSITIVDENNAGNAYILSENWQTINHSNAKGGTYKHNNGTPAVVKENTDSSLNYAGNWQQVNDSAASNGSHHKINGNNVIANNSDSNITYFPVWYESADYNFTNTNLKVKEYIEEYSSSVTFNGGIWQTITYGNGNQDKYVYGCSDPVNNCPNSVELTFTGENIFLVGRNGPSWGKVKVTLFDSLNNVVQIIDNIDLYSPDWKIDQPIAQFYNLPNTQHKIRIESNGTKNPASSNYIYDFDRAIVFSGQSVIQDNYRQITYNGNFTNLAYDDNGFDSYSDHYIYSCANPSSNCPSSIEFQFKGTNLHLIGRKGPDWGNVKVSLFPETSPGSKIFSITPTTLIDNIDMYNSSYLINQTITKLTGLKSQLYKVKIEGAGTKNPSSSNYIYDFDRAIIYPSVEYEFNNSYVTLKTAKNLYSGIVDVSIDGNKVETLDLYNDTPLYFVKTYDNLTLGNHRVTIDSTGTKNSSSQDYLLYLDKFETLPEISGTFSGKEFIYTAQKTPNSGKVNLYIDNVLDSTLDLYSSTNKFEVLRFIKTLADTSHTFKIVAIAEKNVNSTGYDLSFDYIGSGLPSVVHVFQGNEQVIFANRGPNYGIVNVYIDDTPPYQVDLYHPTLSVSEPIITSSFIGGDNLPHTIKIEQTFTKNELSSGYQFSYDASGIGIPNSVITFTGTAITVFGNKGPNLGSVSFRLDGTFVPEAIDLYSPTPEYNVPLKTYTGISPGQHTVTFAAGLSKNSQSSDYRISFDGYEFVNDYKPTITSFTPNNGFYGDEIEITGLKFSNTTSENTVKINGLNVTVLEAIDDLTTPSDDPTYPAEFAERLRILVPKDVTQGKITVTTVKGGSTTSIQDFIPNRKPYPEFTINTVYGTTSTNFIVEANKSSDHEDNTNIQYKWNWGDGNETSYSTTSNNSHTFSTDGYYVITLTVKDSLGSETKSSKTIHVGTQTSGWSDVSDLVTGLARQRRNASAITLRGKVYFIGGNTGSSSPYIDVYDPSTNTWEVRTNFPLGGLQLFGITTYDDKILVYTNKLFIYDTVNDIWFSHGSESDMPTPRGAFQMGRIGTKLYIAGGFDEFGSIVNTVEAYDFVTRTWETVASLPYTNWRGSSVVYNGKFYIFGGLLTTSETSTNVTMVYDPVANSWSTLTGPPLERFDTGAALVNNEVFLMGGFTLSSHEMHHVEKYNIDTNTWTTVTPSIPTNISENLEYGKAQAPAVAVANEIIYINGVKNASAQLTKHNLKFIP